LRLILRLVRALFSAALLLTAMLVYQATVYSGEPDNGKHTSFQYCSSCHGRTGLGDGPVSRDLKVKVPDLTILARKHRRIYPLADVIATIDGRRLVRGHGDREMPVWGDKFRSEVEDKKYPELSTLLKAKIIAEYVGTLQKQ
jgi:mono/diheme cytochrome c family protein